MQQHSLNKDNRWLNLQNKYSSYVGLFLQNGLTVFIILSLPG